MNPSWHLSATLTSWLVIAGLVLAVVAVTVGIIALVRIKKMRSTYRLLQADDGEESFVDVVRRKTEEVQILQRQVDDTTKQVDALRVDLNEAIRHVAVVRYDAFADMGGRMSFSVAFLDDHGDGLVVSSINGRTETRTYAKGIAAGVSDQLLSPEEEQAVNFARRGPAPRDGGSVS